MRWYFKEVQRDVFSVSPSSGTMFVLTIEKMEAGTEDPVEKIKDRNFREVASLRSTPAAIAARIGRPTFAIRMTFTFPSEAQSTDSPSEDRAGRGQKYVGFFAALGPPEAGVSTAADSMEYLPIGRGLPRRPRDRRG
ncbi:hypothetical protein PUN28_012014 [Cardiocondyla obscurior]|uniref:Uncharacterized protein n=1 Tax=Cardiocondyla obscurior TaxID=286306 RepID=A0AAW2FDZ7_9HYME